MIYSTSVTILVISPQMRESNWISWELEYALKIKKEVIYTHIAMELLVLLQTNLMVMHGLSAMNIDR